MKFKTIAIIMAREGSKGLKRKNLKLLNGKPLIAYTIEDAINSGVCDTVLVASEDDEIIEIAKKYGATVSFKRPIDYKEFGDLMQKMNQVAKASFNKKVIK